MAHSAAVDAAEQLAPILGWDEADTAAEVAQYQTHLDTIYRVNRAPVIPLVEARQ